MASPQKENGFTPIANEILEALCKVNLSPYESRALWFLLRKTYGYQRKADYIALSQFSTGTGLDRRLVHRALKGLSSKMMTVIGRDDKNQPTIGFQKDHAKWVFPNRKRASIIGRDDKVSSVEIHTKERKKKESMSGKPDDPFSPDQGLPPHPPTNGKENVARRPRSDHGPVISKTIDHLNQLAGTSYRPTAKATIKLVHARLADGFSLDDFITVLKFKWDDWRDDPKMQRYFRPETLFGSKFEGYLQTAKRNGTSPMSEEEKREWRKRTFVNG